MWNSSEQTPTLRCFDTPSATLGTTLRATLLGALLAGGAFVVPTTAVEIPDDLNRPPKDAIRSPSGLVSKVLQAGDGDYHPDGNDFVNVHFIGWTPEGVEFENTYTKGQPRPFDLSTVFPGWSQGLQQMVLNEKRRLWIPGHLAPPNPAKGPSGPVIFDVELLGIAKVPAMPAKTPPDDAERTPSGAYTVKVSDGNGSNKPQASDGVLVSYFGWTTDGKLFDNTILRGRPTLFLLDQVMPAFAEAVQMMLPGETRQVWIPGNLAKGQWLGSPKGMLIFQVQLEQILDPKMFEQIKNNPPRRPPGG